jgi:hypothetical protein
VSADQAALEAFANSDNLHLTDSTEDGYYFKFQSDGTVDLYEVEEECYQSSPKSLLLYYDVDSRTYLNTYNVADIPVVFVQTMCV